VKQALDVFIGLGSNLGDSFKYLQAGLAGIRKIKGYKEIAVSSPYLTAPVGPQDQGRFVNAVCHGIFSGDPLALLDGLLAVEQAQGRERIRKWGPRTLDLDILLFGDRIIDHPRLKVPHPHMHQRVFVLMPLAELASDLVLPGLGKTASEFLLEMDPEEIKSQKAEKTTWESGT
jgi:2-amino-4-hydroxy-6-hydroxymethyldihydropteridine diphosphokinase